MNVIKCIGKYKIFYVKFVILILRVIIVDLLYLKILFRNILNNVDIYSLLKRWLEKNWFVVCLLCICIL